MLVLIQDLDRPFAGFVNIKPTLISQQAASLAAEYQQVTSAPLPCDSYGTPAG
ncbi:MAG: hypothetical protein JO037_09370 [Actinobacteria bacterium]|nr:hypothetical protein [Actinomycetota bacterium]